MTTVAAPPLTAPLAPPQMDQMASQRTYAAIAPLATSTPSKSRTQADNVSPTSSNGSSHPRGDGKRSPNSSRGPHAPKIFVKKEPPSSPELPISRHRPPRLTLSGNTTLNTSGALTARPSAPLTSKDSAGLGMHEVGLACLSPGFHTQDPTMREQLQRSIEMRDRQRQIIEQRQKGQGKGGNDSEGLRQDANPFRNGMKTPTSWRRKGPPPGLSIAPPSHNQFANERVIQSAPLNQSFTGLRNGLHPPSRQVANQPSNLSHTSHIHHVAATQTNNRLPPISSVFPGEPLGEPRNIYNHSPGHSSHSNIQPPLPSPGFPHQNSPAPTSGRPREYKSAEEAVQSMSGGREDLLPRIVHYGGHQPPTPPSPMPPKSAHPSMQHSMQHGLGMSGMDLHRSGSGRRRGRDEYERDMGTPPLGRQEAKRGPFGEPRDTPEENRRKKEEFISLCARAWDLFHS